MNNSMFSMLNITGCTNQYLALAILFFLFLCSKTLGIAPNSRARGVLHFIWTVGKQLYDKYLNNGDKKTQPTKVKIKNLTILYLI